MRGAPDLQFQSDQGTMQRRGFDEAVDLAVSKDSRYDRDAYTFLRESLEFTLKASSSRSGSDDRHVSGQELMNGFRDFALQEFGPMAVTVFDEWGIRSTKDIGAMVFNLVDVGAFGKTDEDKEEDFHAGYDFHNTFEKPFLPSSWNEREGKV